MAHQKGILNLWRTGEDEDQCLIQRFPTLKIRLRIIRGDIFSKRLSCLVLLFYNFFGQVYYVWMFDHGIPKHTSWFLNVMPPPLPLNLTASVEFYYYPKVNMKTYSAVNNLRNSHEISYQNSSDVIGTRTNKICS